MSFTGTLLAESLRMEAVLEGVPLQVRRIWRSDAGDPSAGQPVTWTFIDFEVPHASATRLAELLSTALGSGPWYCDFRDDEEIVVVFTGRVFRYAAATAVPVTRSRLTHDLSGCRTRRSTGPSSPDRRAGWRGEPPSSWLHEPHRRLPRARVEKRYEGSGRYERADREHACLVSLAHRLPVPEVVERDPAVPLLIVRHAPGCTARTWSAQVEQQRSCVCWVKLWSASSRPTWAVPGLVGTGPVIVHGDFGPQNVLVEGDRSPRSWTGSSLTSDSLSRTSHGRSGSSACITRVLRTPSPSCSTPLASACRGRRVIGRWSRGVRN